MAFMDRLRERGVFNDGDSGSMMNTSIMQPSSGPFGTPMQDPTAGMINNLMPAFHEMRNRDMQDFQQRQNILQNQMPIRQDRMRQSFDPGGMNEQPNVVFNPGNEMSAFQRANLQLEESKLRQSRETGEDKLNLDRERVGLGHEKQQLDELKNRQIYETRLKESEDKATASDKKLELAERALKGKENDAIANDQFRRAKEEALQARHDLEMLQKDEVLDENRRQFDAKYKQTQDALDAAGYEITETEDSSQPGRKITKVVKKGAGNNTQPGNAPKDPLGIRK